MRLLLLTSIVLLSGACDRVDVPILLPDARVQVRLPGIVIEGLGEVMPGQALNERKLHSSAPNAGRNWDGLTLGPTTTWSRGQTTSTVPGYRIPPTSNSLYEEIGLRRGRVWKVRQILTVVRQKCEDALRSVFLRLRKTVLDCMSPGGLMRRRVLRDLDWEHVWYFCLCDKFAVWVDLTTDQATRMRSLSVNIYLLAEARHWFRGQMAEDLPARAGEFKTDLRPLTKHFQSCGGDR